MLAAVVLGVALATTKTPAASPAAASSAAASLAHELRAFGVRAKLVEPGYGPTTGFTANGQARMHGLVTAPYAPFAEQVFAQFAAPPAVTRESDVAHAVWQAVHDTSGQVRFPAGADAVALAKGAGTAWG